MTIPQDSNTDRSIKKLSINGTFELTSNKIIDSRGFFLNCFRVQDNSFNEIWGSRNIKQINLSNTRKKGTIRGLHFQNEPYMECKLIKCLKGRVWDVAVDLRKKSTTYLNWLSIELSPELNNAILIPEGCAHGFQSLKDNSELLYIHSNVWNPSFEDGIRWNDSQLNINWPLNPINISERDQSFPNLKK